jgi:hypothetical protein
MVNPTSASSGLCGPFDKGGRGAAGFGQQRLFHQRLVATIGLKFRDGRAGVGLLFHPF